VKPAIASLAPFSKLDGIGWDLNVPDVVRAKLFIDELRQFEARGFLDMRPGIDQQQRQRRADIGLLERHVGGQPGRSPDVEVRLEIGDRAGPDRGARNDQVAQPGRTDA